MNRKNKTIFVILVLFIISTVPAYTETDTTTWSKDAEMVYDTGFMQMLMKHPDGGVGLFNMELIENDSPGAGVSTKGVCTDVVWGKNRARKILHLDDTRAYNASLFIFLRCQGKYPLKFEINGHPSQIDNWKQKGYERFRWTGFPTEWLKKGKNIIDLYCPEAESVSEGWEIWLARADEFEEGGGDPKDVGKTSFKSFNAGKSWKESPFGIEAGSTYAIDGFTIGAGKKQKGSGNDRYDRAEYSIRISLDRYIKTGWLASPVIDLWKGDPDDFFVRMRTLRKLSVSIKSVVPEDTDIQYYIRRGISPGPCSGDWEPYEFAGSGPNLDFEAGSEFNRRYIQFKAVLKTENPFNSPVVKSVHITANFKEPYPVPLHKNIYVLEVDNPKVKYPSVEWEWEKWDRPEFGELRKRENLDKVIAGSRTTFEAQVRLLDYATKRWRWTPPLPEYPRWDALSTVDRINKAGGAGMCIQFNNFLAGMYMAYGWQARLINIDGHEICEVWNDEYGKWIYMDASTVNHYFCDIKTGEPLSMLEIHDMYMDYYYPGRPMDWLNDYRYSQNVIREREDKPPLIRSSPTYHLHERSAYTGFVQARFMRMVPRNNWYEKPYPRPLAHGNGSHWPWNVYINWYDERTPPRLQYSWHTDRKQDMWPDLNTVHIHAAQGYGNDRLFLHFETYTPNFSHFEVNTDGNGWESADEQWTWLLIPGKNNLEVRAVNKSGAKGKPSSVVVSHVLVPMNEWETAY